MKRLWRSVAVLILCTVNAVADAGHGATAASEPGGKNYFTVNAVSDQFELVLRYIPIEAGDETHFTLFLSDYLTNKPIDSARFEISSPEDPTLKFNVTRSDVGTYEIDAAFPQKKNYQLTVAIRAGTRSDLILVGPIEVGKQLPVAAQVESNAAGNGMMKWWWVLAAFIAGIGGTYLAMRARMRRMSRPQQALSALLFVTVASMPASLNRNATAHEGHGPEVKKTGNLADEFEVGKETQFLYRLYTAPPTNSDFATLVVLNGRVIPATNGSARIVAPQTGTITSLNVAIGQRVSKGQTLAVVQQTLATTEQVRLATERAAAEAEYQAAQKDYDRLQTLKDIVAKKELQAAEIRLNAARENRAVYERLGGGVGRSFTVVSPVAGVVDNFNLSVGQQVQQGDAIMNVYDNRTLKVEATIYPADLAAVTDSARYTVSMQDDPATALPATVQALGKAVDPTNQSTTLVLQVDNASGRLLPGQLVNVSVSTKALQRRASFPAEALTDIDGKPAVFIHPAPEMFKVVYVQGSGANAAASNSLLRPNDRVVVNGVYMLKSIYQNQ